jgi:hypothetical protein
MNFYGFRIGVHKKMSCESNLQVLCAFFTPLQPLSVSIDKERFSGHFPHG